MKPAQLLGVVLLAGALPAQARPLDPAIERESHRIAREEARRWRHLMPRSAPHHARLSGDTWINLGPTDAYFQWNGNNYTQVDSGRPSGIAVDPRDPEVVYLATSGGGVWKTYDFVSSAPNPTWAPVTDEIGNLAIGAIDLAASSPDTLYISLGDAFDVPGDAVLKTTDGGASWSEPVALRGTYPASAGGLSLTARSTRDLKVDPADARIVLVASDVGLFRSADGGASFQLIDLPNDGPTQVPEGLWSIAYAGRTAAGSSVWVASGIYSCAPDQIPAWAGYGAPPGGTSYMSFEGLPCPVGNLGDLWRSTDGGLSWSSGRAAGHFIDFGRAAIAAGAPRFDPDTTTVYAMLSSVDEFQSATIAVWRSDDGGQSWNDATGVLANPTSNSDDCADTNLAHDQAWYNLAIAVDPGDPSKVIAGGNLCGARTLTGTTAVPTWELVAHWLPSGGGGQTAAGPLPYVHADWHAALVVDSGGLTRVLAGTDGGLFSSTNVFDRSVAAVDAVWDFHNRGIVSHLTTGLASGDPADGNPFVVIAGFQDNGVRFRDSAAHPTVFNQVLGGDGFEAAISTGLNGTVYLASQQYARSICIPIYTDCNTGGAWTPFDPPITTSTLTEGRGEEGRPFQGDEFPFFTRVTPVPTSTLGGVFLTISDAEVWISSFTSTPTWTPIGSFDFIRNVAASATIPHLYGVALPGGLFAVTDDRGQSWTPSVQIGDGTSTVAEASSISFPPTVELGTRAGDVYVAASEARTLDDPSQSVPARLGHLFLTRDRGASFTPIHGDGSGDDLPNVPVLVVRYDPGDPSNDTIYAGTDLGLYRTLDRGRTWERYGAGLPLVRITDLFIARSSSLIRVATYGRGIWEIYPSSSAARGVSGDGDFDKNGVIDWADLGALAARLGTTPASTGLPLYSSIDDLTPGRAAQPVDAIDDDDLSALLGVFGGRP